MTMSFGVVGVGCGCGSNEFRRFCYHNPEIVTKEGKDDQTTKEKFDTVEVVVVVVVEVDFHNDE